ncbi:MAG TPA: sugar phosphate isomerase/epimerase family protein [Candidatus Acidoferrales bacterium]|nr:sugar phosphate isomerase/epimerase family protein [Candidatus Acidoferrales bacterium]
MQRVFSTYRYSDEPLTSVLLAEIAQAGISQVEIYCTPVHLNYRSASAIRTLAEWIGEHRLTVHSLHSPTERDLLPGKRESGIPISISDPERVRRLDAVDEVKRTLEIAEQIPFRYLVQHIGNGREKHDPRKFDAAFNSLEHLAIFAKQRGVSIALENTPGELGSPPNLRHFVTDTRLDLKFCFDVGHAHMEEGVEISFEPLREHVVMVHAHDNHGEKDEHLLPHSGKIDWDAAMGLLSGTGHDLPVVLELRAQSSTAPSLADATTAFEKLEQSLAAKRSAANS